MPSNAFIGVKTVFNPDLSLESYGFRTIPLKHAHLNLWNNTFRPSPRWIPWRAQAPGSRRRPDEPRIEYGAGTGNHEQFTGCCFAREDTGFHRNDVKELKINIFKGSSRHEGYCQRRGSEAKRNYGYFALLSNEIKDAVEALTIYRNKDLVEKAFFILYH